MLTIFNGLFRVERALGTRETLADHPGVLGDDEVLPRVVVRRHRAPCSGSCGCVCVVASEIKCRASDDNRDVLPRVPVTVVSRWNISKNRRAKYHHIDCSCTHTALLACSHTPTQQTNHTPVNAMTFQSDTHALMDWRRMVRLHLNSRIVARGCDQHSTTRTGARGRWECVGESIHLHDRRVWECGCWHVLSENARGHVTSQNLQFHLLQHTHITTVHVVASTEKRERAGVRKEMREGRGGGDVRLWLTTAGAQDTPHQARGRHLWSKVRSIKKVPQQSQVKNSELYLTTRQGYV